MISGRTKLFCVVGDPIEQVKTPDAINPVFVEKGYDIVCVPQRVTASGLQKAWEGFRSTENLVGLGVTLPHKRRVAALCDRLDETAELTGVVNCVRREADGSMFGALFDGLGFVQGLLSEGYEPSGHKVLLIGAGGAATAIAFALADAGVASITVANRTQERAGTLVDQVNTHARASVATVGRADPKGHTLVINSTSLGLRSSDEIPINVDALTSGMLVVDVIAKPDWTPLLSAAQGKGCAVHFGHHMIDHQVELIANFVAAGR